jgi:alkanesulfonate monooxygenase SsuD/methylene tetrahydromethanopterin reductase-like flavin-dependent oxidoreductase (luciferase family)
MPTFGVMHDFRQPLPWRISAAAYHAECFELIEAAESLGYEAVWLSEHHGTADGFSAAPLVLAAAIAARTHRLKVGTNVLLLPLHHPIRVAEDGAAIHAISGGRFILGVGQGYARHEFELFGVERSHRPSRLEEGLSVIRQAWRDGRTGFSGKRFALPDGPFEPRPDAPAPIYVGATGGPALDRAVRLADGLLTYVAEPRHARERYANYADALERHGRARETFPFVLTGVCHVHADADQAWEQAAPGIAYLESALRPEPLRPEDLDRADYLVGTPDDVAERLAALYADVPFDQFAFWARLPGISKEQAATAQRLFAEAVRPHFRQEN